MDLDAKLNQMINKSKVEDAMTIDSSQDLSVDKNEAPAKVEPEKPKEPVSEAAQLLAEFFKQETKNGQFFDHNENKLRKEVQKFLIENDLIKEHECARRVKK